MPTLRLETLVRASPEDCFDLSLSVDAHTASMGPSGERAVDGITEGRMGPLDTVTWRARHFGLPFRMTSTITAWDRPRRFVDEQVAGPFRSWRHEHTFTPHLDRTLMVDIATFEAPYGVLGRAAETLVLTRYLMRLLSQRNDWLRTELERA
ncbi:SRPBCC family protein [Nocardioides sp. CER19]|uniref:SRPBCC family protein n=1 Tax=Nocardioides sp. CER19 TaxID=3038538 RepID=UPI002449AD37|nr:SRPBCC family protein [Nocardioides sp. CER19]MDH2413686.1 SRPBCC family protein [Nocardioides sp. CER19]